MPTKPFSIGISTCRPVGEIMRAVLILATIWSSGMSKSAISRGGIAPPQGLIRPVAVEKRDLVAGRAPDLRPRWRPRPAAHDDDIIFHVSFSRNQVRGTGDGCAIHDPRSAITAAAMKESGFER